MASRVRSFLARPGVRAFVGRVASARVSRRVAGRLHRAASGLAAVTSEVDAYAGLLEEKADALHAKTHPHKSP